MRHCSSCAHCILDIKALRYCGVVVDKCKLTDNLVLTPFIDGIMCKCYKKRFATPAERGGNALITIQTKLDGFPEDVQSTEEPEPSAIPFPSPGNISTGQAVGIFKYRLADETVPIWAKVLAIEKIAAFETLNSITKDELQHALHWLFEHFDFDV